MARGEGGDGVNGRFRCWLAIGAWLVLALLGSGCARLAHLAQGGEQSQTLTQADSWRLAVTKDQDLVLFSESGQGRTSDFTQPPTLNEASAVFLARDGKPITLVKGPVTPDATAVVIETIDGIRTEVAVVEAYGMTWFWAELPGHVRPAELTAENSEGAIVDEFTLPPMPGPPPAPRDAPPP